MCTVTFIPDESGGFTLTQNRDVRPSRYATELVQTDRSGELVLYPEDPIAGGTWISASSADRVFCVMNGALQSHEMGGKYRMSRGLIALQLFDYTSAYQFFQQIDLDQIEPFTMIAYDHGDLLEFRWDGQEKLLSQKDVDAKHIWASSTLYNAHWQGRRQFWFNQWTAEISTPTQEDILAFHLLSGDGDPENDLVMNRKDLVATVSVSMIKRQSNSIDFLLKSLASDIELRGQVNLK